VIVEFIGASGAGKTTLARMLMGSDEVAGPVKLDVDLVTDRLGRRWIDDPRAVNLLTDVTVFPSFLRTLRRNQEFVRFAFDRLTRHAPSRFAKVNYPREVARNVGKLEWARRAAGDATVLIDEGPVLTAYHLFVYSDAPFGDADLRRFARLVPLPDRIVYVRAPLDVLVDRAMRRPDRRRELATDDRGELKARISRAQEVFDALAGAPRLRDRLLIVDNADESEDAVERLSAFVDEGTSSRRHESASSPGSWTSPIASGAVVAIVGSEATGKSTILDEIDDRLSRTRTVRRVHAGKPPSTRLTFVPHVLLPAFRELFPGQRSLRVEARYAGAPEPARKTYPLLFGFRSVMLAYERRVLLLRARARAAEGMIVLSDRYPSSRSGAPDSPQLGHLPTPSGGVPLRRWLTALEARLYRDIPPADLVIHLTAPLDVTLARNAARAKTEPEPYVRFRHSLSSDLEFRGAAVHRIDTDRPLEAVVREVEEVLRQMPSHELRADTAADVPISGGGG
jgi:thymidylate kinase